MSAPENESNSENEAYRYDAGQDQFVRTVTPPHVAPDAKGGLRTEMMGAHDEVSVAENDTLVIAEAQEEIDGVPGRDGEIVRLEYEIALATPALSRGRVSEEESAERVRELDYYALPGSKRRLQLEWVLVPVMVLGEAALGLVGLKLALPDLGQAAGDPVLGLIAERGADVAACAIGAGCAFLQIEVGRELARANRGVLSDPPGHGKEL